MANISRANGDVTLKGPAKSVRSFLNLMSLVKDNHYNLNIDVDIDKLENYNDDEIIEKVFVFDGRGRWNYDETLSMIMRGINQERSNLLDIFSRDEFNWTVGLELDWLQLNEHPLDHVRFEFVDFEQGIGFLAEVITDVIWSKGEFADVKIDNISNHYNDITADNIHRLIGDVVYDYTPSTIDNLNDESIDWNKYIKKYVGNDLPTVEDIDTFTDDLKSKLDQMTNQAIWYTIDDWFNDRNIQKEIKNTLK